MFQFLVITVLTAEPVALDLDGFMELALLYSPVVQQSLASGMQAEASFVTARAALLPKLNLSASGGHTWADVEANSYMAGLSLSQEIPFSSGGASLLATRSASLGRDQARYGQEASLLGLKQSVATAFYRAAEALMQVSAAEAALERSSTILRRVEVLYETGSATSIDLCGARVKETEDRLALLERNQRSTAAMEALFTVSGIRDISGFTVDTTRVPDPLTESEVLALGELTGCNPSILAGRVGLQRAELNARAASGSWLPSISLGGSVGVSDDELDFGELGKKATWGVNLSISIPIFDGWQRSGQTKAARAAVLLAEADLATAEIENASSERVALGVLLTSVAGLDLANLRLEYARQKAELNSMKYGMGSLDLSDLLEAQADLSEAEAARITALTNCLVAEVDYRVLNGMSPRMGN